MEKTMLKINELINKVHNKDCLEFLNLVPNNSIDLIVTSPPYNVRKQYGNQLDKNRPDTDDQRPWDDYYIWMGKIIRECYRVLQIGGTIAINVPGVIRFQRDHLYADSWHDYDPNYKTHHEGKKILGKGRIEPLGWKLWQIMFAVDEHMREPIIWVKGNEGTAISGNYQMGCDSDPYFRATHEMILFGSKGQWFHRGGTGRRGAEAVPYLDYCKDVWFVPPVSNKYHPATFPQEIPERLIKLFVHAKDSIILDPFMGIGSTAMAAKRLGFDWMGCELNGEFCKIANDNVSQDVLIVE